MMFRLLLVAAASVVISANGFDVRDPIAQLVNRVIDVTGTGNEQEDTAHAIDKPAKKHATKASRGDTFLSELSGKLKQLVAQYNDTMIR